MSVCSRLFVGLAALGLMAPLSACSVRSTGPCDGECSARLYSVCTCAPDDPCGYRNDGVCDDACYQIGDNPFNDASDCAPVVTIVDDDLDGIDDVEEEWFAKTFAPVLQFATGEQFSERFASWLVEPTTSGVSIFYALSYYEDGGEEGSGANASLGDPEFVVVDVVETASGDWDVAAVFLSAYYGDIGADVSAWWAGGLFEYDTTGGGSHPVVYVSAQDHAMFPSIAECDLGAWSPGLCDQAGSAEIDPTVDGNLGNPAYQFWDDLVLEFEGVDYSEWYFTEVRFCGWWVVDGDPRNDCAYDGYAGLIADWLRGL